MRRGWGRGLDRRVALVAAAIRCAGQTHGFPSSDTLVRAEEYLAWLRGDPVAPSRARARVGRR